jgi:hypothetical protein
LHAAIPIGKSLEELADAPKPKSTRKSTRKSSNALEHVLT